MLSVLHLLPTELAGAVCTLRGKSMADPLIVGTLAGIVGIGIGYLVDRVIKGGAYKTRDEILQQAQRDAENVRKDEELKIKEDMLRRREELESRLEESRGQLRVRISSRLILRSSTTPSGRRKKCCRGLSKNWPSELAPWMPKKVS